MERARQLQVEVYAHGGWWKDSSGRTGQIPPIAANNGPLTTVAVLANGFGIAGWTLTDVVSTPHNTFRLSFALTADDEQPGEARPAGEVPAG